MDNSSKYALYQEETFSIQVVVDNPTQVKTTLSSYTVYKIKGNDKRGQFQCMRRYSQFDLLRLSLLKRWPGCYVPPLPEKKMVGNSNVNFVQNRKHALEVFCRQMACLPHLWYSQQFDIFIRKSGDVEANLKALPAQNHEQIIKKYDQKFSKLRGRSIDTNLIAKVLQFNKYLKRVQPLLTHYKQFLVFFSETKTNNYEQFSILFNYVLPQYERTCLSNYLDQKVSGKLIFSDENDQRLASFVNRLKQMISKRNFDQLLMQIQHQERQINAFLDVFKQHSVYEKKVTQLKQKQKSLQIEQQQLSMGKQSLIKSFFKGKIDENKKDVQRQISVTKDFFTTYSLLSDLITMLLGFFEIDRFRQTKLKIYNQTIRQVAKIQVEYCRLQKQLCNHILDNHNLM